MTSVTQWIAVFLFSALNFISRGWCASFTTHSNGTNSNTFYSPNYPNNYPNDHDELYIAYLLTPGPQEVLLEYDINTEATSYFTWSHWTTVCVDYVYFPELSEYMCSQMQGKRTMLVPGDRFNFSFHSNWRYRRSGFWIRFTVLEASTTPQTIMTTKSDPQTTPDLFTTARKDTTEITTIDTTENVVTTTNAETTTTEKRTTTEDETTTIENVVTTADDETTSTENVITTTSDEMTTITSASDDTTTSTSDDTTTIITASDDTTATQNVMTTTSDEITSQRETHETTHDSPTTTAIAGTTEQLQMETTTRQSSSPRPFTLSREQRPCNCIRLEAPPKNATADDSQELEEKKKELVQQIKDNLTVSAANVSATRRRYVSASDDRSSSVVMGMFIAVVCFMPLMGIVVADSLRLALAVYRSLSK